MFFLFVLKEKGFPISDVFEKEIKDIPTTRFSTHFDDEYKHIYFSIKQERRHAKKERELEKLDGFGIERELLSPLTERVFTYVKKPAPMRQSMVDRLYPSNGLTGESFIIPSELSDSNFVPINIEKPLRIKRPSCVPPLDLFSMPHYEESSSSSSEESGSEENGKHKNNRGPNPR